MTSPEIKLADGALVALAEAHIVQFSNMLTRARYDDTGIRTHECMNYLKIWNSIKRKAGKNLTEDELREVSDAMYSGEYDDVLGINSNEITHGEWFAMLNLAGARG